jgi:5-methylcytosine-specific restriction endonuclease McrA
LPTKRSLRGHRWRQIAAKFRQRCAAVDAPCWLCGQPIDYTAKPQTESAFEADHKLPVETHPHLAFMTGNLRPSHSSCNRSRGSKPAVVGDWVSADF